MATMIIAIRVRGVLLGKRFTTVGEALDWGALNITHDDWKLEDV